jgi:hypothetical protein
VHHRGEGAGPADDGDVAVVIGAEQRHAQPSHLGQQHRRRMAVVVVQAHADHGDRRMNRGQEGGVGVRRAVMRHLEDVGPQVGAGVQQPTLGLDLGVAGQQDAHAADLGPHHEGGVVGIGASARVGRRRPQHVEVHLADVERGADRRAQYRQPLRRRHPVHDRRTGFGIVERTAEDARHRSAAHDAG